MRSLNLIIEIENFTGEFKIIDIKTGLVFGMGDSTAQVGLGKDRTKPNIISEVKLGKLSTKKFKLDDQV